LEIDYLRHTGELCGFPSTFAKEYKSEINWGGNDEKGIFKFTMDEEKVKKLYFDDGMSVENVAGKYRSLRIEQDVESMEMQVLQGTQELIKNVLIIICCFIMISI
jgi:hypothetical protein